MAKKCSMCGSKSDLINCYFGDYGSSFLCAACREEYLFDEQGNLKEKELGEFFDNYDWQALALEEGEQMSPSEAAFVRSVLG